MLSNELLELRKLILPETEALMQQEGFPDTVCHCVAVVFGASGVARREGLLALEEMFRDGGSMFVDEEYYTYTREFCAKFPLLEQLGQLIVDGTFPEHVTFFGVSSILRETDAGTRFIKLLILTGMLLTQDGTHPLVIKKMLYSMIPESCWKQLDDAIQNYGNPDCITWVKEPGNVLSGTWVPVLTQKQQEELLDDLREEQVESIRELEQIIGKTSDRFLQRLLRDVNYYVLLNAMMGLSVGAGNKVFENLSKRLRANIREDMSKELLELQMRKRIHAAADAAPIIIGIYRHLRDAGEID